MLKVTNLNAWYGDVQVLYDVNIEVKEKEIVTEETTNAYVLQV